MRRIRVSGVTDACFTCTPRHICVGLVQENHSIFKALMYLEDDRYNFIEVRPVAADSVPSP